MHSKSTLHSSPVQYNYLGDHAIVLSINTSLSTNSILQIKKTTVACYALKSIYTWIKDIIPAYQTITIVFDVTGYYQSEKMEPLLFFKKELPSFIEKENAKPPVDEKTTLLQIPVCYDPQFGIDLAALAAYTKQSIETIIELHHREIYTVYCIGFMPGFAYMGKVPEAIQMPRHATPRPKVFSGSVGIAGPQTGIYPMDSPGGWQIIGKTPLPIFDPHPSKLALLKTGDQVQFYPISVKELTSFKGTH